MVSMLGSLDASIIWHARYMSSPLQCLENGRWYFRSLYDQCRLFSWSVMNIFIGIYLVTDVYPLAYITVPIYFVPSSNVEMTRTVTNNNNFHVVCSKLQLGLGVELPAQRSWIQQHPPVSFNHGDPTRTVLSTRCGCRPVTWPGIEPGERSTTEPPAYHCLHITKPKNFLNYFYSSEKS